jgi:LacI family transcriptional regulator
MIVGQLIKDKRSFDGIFAVNDIAAFGAIKAAQSAHFSIPKDIAIVGFSDWMFSAIVAPSISTVSQQGYKMGQKAAELLLQEINSKDTFVEPTHITLPTHLIVRQSS